MRGYNPLSSHHISFALIFHYSAGFLTLISIFARSFHFLHCVHLLLRDFFIPPHSILRGGEGNFLPFPFLISWLFTLCCEECAGWRGKHMPSSRQPEPHFPGPRDARGLAKGALSLSPRYPAPPFSAFWEPCGVNKLTRPFA
ncbi:hypothetical protein SUGI_0051680 [Cryptomeria japonica]|nr:hypothetical protein SUGI_0051680 [Cryptomeria japonica]